MSEDLRVWVGCLACYNAGILVGEWVDAVDAAEYRPHLNAGHGSESFAKRANERHEETWCFDHEGFPAGTGEMSPSEATAIAETLSESFDGYPVAAVYAYACNSGYSVTTVEPSEFEESYSGEWDSELDYAHEIVSDGYFYGVSDDSPLRLYFDYDAFARDLFMGDYWSAPSPDGGVFVFRSI